MLGTSWKVNALPLAKTMIKYYQSSCLLDLSHPEFRLHTYTTITTFDHLKTNTQINNESGLRRRDWRTAGHTKERRLPGIGFHLACHAATKPLAVGSRKCAWMEASTAAQLLGCSPLHNTRRIPTLNLSNSRRELCSGD